MPVGLPSTASLRSLLRLRLLSSHLSTNNTPQTRAMSSQPDMRSATKTFFSSPHFAVAGASSTPSKFGHRIFAWYLNHDIPAIPLNPSCSSVTVRGQQYNTVPAPSKLPDPKHTSLSVITPPPVTAKVLEDAKKAGVRAVWLQPGSFTDEEMEYALKEFPGAAIGGFSAGTVGGEGWCVLVDGEAAMKAAAADQKKTKEPAKEQPSESAKWFW